MKKLRVRPVTILGLLLVAALIALLWQPRSDFSQKRQEHLNDALLNAAMYGDVAAARDLLHSGADPNSCQQPSSLWEKLQRACPPMHYMNHSDPRPLYETALGLAVLNGKSQVVHVLLAGGADVREEDSYGQTALDLANATNDDGIFLMLEKAAEKRAPAEVVSRSH